MDAEAVRVPVDERKNGQGVEEADFHDGEAGGTSPFPKKEETDFRSCSEMAYLYDSPRSSAGQIQPADLTMEAIMGSTEALQEAVEDLWRVAGEFDVDSYTMEKIHRFPASLRGLGDRYIVPMAVAIGPYHHGLPHLQEMEKVKRIACFYFITESGHSPEEIYEKVLSVAGDARRLYADDAVAGISDADFAAMMFRDALFLLQYMQRRSNSGDPHEMGPSFQHFLYSNRACIDNDIMLLENQLPWLVVEILMEYWSVDVDKFIAPMIRGKSQTPFVLHGRYRPPHLLGLILFSVASESPPSHGATQVSVSSAIELAEIGIKLTASRTAKFMDMGFKEGLLFAEIFLAPLSLDVLMASSLVNMAAFEVCTGSTVTRPRTSRLQDAGEKTDVCSYIRLLAMLMDREEDVHELRTKRLVNGDLTNMQTLDFFKGLTEHLYGGPRYVRLLAKIEDYKCRRWMKIRLHKFVYNNSKTIITVFTVVGVLVGIFKALLSLKQHRP